MARLPEIQSSGPAITRAPQSRVSANDIANVGKAQADTMDTLKTSIEDIATPLAEQAGAQLVTKDENGNIVVAKPFPTFGKLADVERKSATMTYAAQMKSAAESYFQDLSNKTFLPTDQGGGGGDPQWFDTQARAWVKQQANNQRGGMQTAALQEGNLIADQYQRSLQTKRASIDAQEQKQTLQTQAESLDNEAVALARQNYGGPEFTKAFNDYATTMRHMADDPRFGISKAYAEAKIQEAASKHKANFIIGEVEKSYDPARGGSWDAASKKAQTILTDPALNLDEAQRKTYYNAAIGTIRQMEGERKAQVDALSKEGREIAANIRKGVPQSGAALDDFKDRAGKVGATGILFAIAKEEAASNMQKQFGSMSLQEQQRIISGGGPLMQRESGGDPSVINQLGYAGLYQFGAPRLAAMGVYQPGNMEAMDTWSKTDKNFYGKWSGTLNIPGFPEVKTLKDFLANPEAQKTAFNIHVQKMDQESASSGLDKYIGQTVGGVQITRDSIRNMMHLGGLGGAKRFLESGGRENAADANGTRVSDYASLGGSGGGQAAAASGGRGVIPPASVARSQARAEQDQMQAQRLQTIYDNKASPMSDPYVASVLTQSAKETIGYRLPEMMKAFDQYETPNKADVDALGAMVGQIGTPEQQRQMAAIGVRAEFAETAKSMSPAELDAALNRKVQEYKESGSESQRGQVAWMQKWVANLQENFAKDPWGTAAQIGINTPSTKAAINFNDMGAMQAGIAGRERDQSIIRTRQGLGAFSVFTDGELGQAREVLKNGTADQQTGMIASLAKLPDDVMKATLNKLYESKDVDPQIVAASLYKERPEVSRSILTGIKIMQQDPKAFESKSQEINKRIVEMVPPADVATDASGNSTIGTWMAMKSAIQARAADLNFKAGKTGPNIDSATVEQAIEDVTGGVMKWGGKTIFMPKYGMGEGEFRKVMGSLDQTDLGNSRGVDGKALTSKDLTSWTSPYKLQPLGDGKYLVYAQGASAYATSGATSSQTRVYVQQQSNRAAREGGPFVLDLKGASERVLR